MQFKGENFNSVAVPKIIMNDTSSGQAATGVSAVKPVCGSKCSKTCLSE